MSHPEPPGSSYAALANVTATSASELYGLGLIPGGGLWAVGDFEPNGVVQPLIEFNPAP